MPRVRLSKALVIMDADFSENKLGTVALFTPIPCTGLTLDKSTVAFTKYGETESLTVNKTPSDTTDAVVWSSSDEDVATVSGGVITAVGVGTCTITAACGNREATCEVTAKVIYEESDLYRANGYGIICNPWNTNRMSAQASAGYGAFAMGTNVLGNKKLAYDGASVLGQDVYPIPLPKGASSLKIVSPDSDGTHTNAFYMYFIDSTTNQSYSSAEGAAVVSSHTIDSPGTLPTWDLTELDASVDSFTFSFRCVTGNTPAEQTNPVVVTIE